MELGLGLALAVMSSVAYAAGAVVQLRLARDVSGRRGPLWVSAVGLNLAGAGLHVLALRYGPLSLIQALGSLTLVFALPASAAVTHRRVSRREWVAAGMVVVGLVGLLTLIRAPGEEGLTDRGLVVVLAVTAVVLALLGGVGLGTRRTPVRTLALAAASGVAFGVASAMTQTLAVLLSDDGPAALGGAVPLLGLAAVGVLAGLGFLLAQAAYRGGLGAPLAAGTLVNAISATVIGLALLGEYYAFGVVGGAVAVVAAVLAGVGVVRLTVSGVRTG